MIEANLLLLGYGIVVGLLAGSAGGILAAIAGVGGGLIYVPVFYALMPQGNSSLSMPVLASMLAIVLTGGFSARAHLRLGHVDRATTQTLAPVLVLTAAAGLWSTLKLPEAIVLAALASLDLWVALDYGRPLNANPGQIRTGRNMLFAAPIGFLSGMLGIGGGTMLVPLLRRSLPLRQAVGTSAMCGVLMAAGAAMINLIGERDWHAPIMTQASFIIGSLLGILIVLPRTTHWAAKLHDRIEEATMRIWLRGLFFTLSAALASSALWQIMHA